MKYLIRFEVEYEIVLNADLFRNDLSRVAEAVKDCIKEEVLDYVKIRPCHVEPKEREEA